MLKKSVRVLQINFRNTPSTDKLSENASEAHVHRKELIWNKQKLIFVRMEAFICFLHRRLGHSGTGNLCVSHEQQLAHFSKTNC